MITNIKQLITECTLELKDRQYRKDYADKIISYWENLSEWMQVDVSSCKCQNNICEIEITLKEII